MSTERPATSPSRLAPWLHAGAALAAGAVLFPVAQRSLVAGILGGPAALAVLVVVVVVIGAVFGALGSAFMRRPRGRWLALTGLVYVPAVAAASLINTENGSMALDDPRSYVFCAAIPATLALIVHAGIPRIVGAIAVVAIVAFAGLGGLSPKGTEYVDTGTFAFDFLPYGTSLEGYVQLGDPRLVTPDVLLVTYLPTGAVVTEAYREPGEITMLTERTTELCAEYVFGVDRAGGAQLEETCEVTGGLAVRTSAVNHEVSQRFGNVVVRAIGALDVPLDELRAALEAARGLDEYPVR